MVNAGRFSLVAALLVVACRSKLEQADAGSAPVASNAAPSEPRVFGKWTQDDGVEWRVLVVRAGMTSGELHYLARQLHQKDPLVFFDLYDHDAELSKLVAARGDDDALPAEWRKQHAVASIVGTVKAIDGGTAVGGFQLFDWRSGKQTPLP